MLPMKPILTRTMLLASSTIFLSHTAYAGDFEHEVCSLPSGTHYVVEYDASANGSGTKASPFNT